MTNLFYCYTFVSEKLKIIMMQAFVQAILQTQSSYRQLIQQKMKEYGINLSFEMLHVLRTLDRSGKVNQQELANLSFKDKSSLSYLIKNLEKKQLIYRQEDGTDKRSKLVMLTPKGKELYTKIHHLVNDVYEKIEGEVNIDHMRRCIDYMKEFNESIKN